MITRTTPPHCQKHIRSAFRPLGWDEGDAEQQDEEDLHVEEGGHGRPLQTHDDTWSRAGDTERRHEVGHRVESIVKAEATPRASSTCFWPACAQSTRVQGHVTQCRPKLGAEDLRDRRWRSHQEQLTNIKSDVVALWSSCLLTVGKETQTKKHTDQPITARLSSHDH